MGQEECETEAYGEKNIRKGAVNMKNSKRILSLVLALIMVCSTMGVMVFAQERSVINCHECPVASCSETRCVEKNEHTDFDCIVECPTHGTHDAERHYVYVDHWCGVCDVVKEENIFVHYMYICLE